MDNLQKEVVFEANRKSKGIAYLLWFLVGWTGAHRFYAGETKTGAIQLVMALSVIGIPFLFFWLLADIFLIPGMINERNLELIHALNSDAPRGPVSTAQLRDDRMRDDRMHDDREYAPSPESEPAPALDSKRARMLEDLKATGYRKKPRNGSELYR